jgi:streptomycin 6-kinase
VKPSRRADDALRSQKPTTVPADVVRAVCARWPDRGQAWSTSVGADFAELCRRYRAQPRQVLNARYGFVVSVATADGLLVLKSTPDPAGAFQADAAQQLAKLGVGPVIREAVESTTGTWTVMNQVLPGTQAIQSASIDELASVLQPLTAVSRETKFPPISSWLRERLLNGDDVDLPPGVPAASREERERALPILAELAADESSSLCHGDPSSGNVLLGTRGLQLIDPRAMSGGIEYDIAVLALKAGREVSDLARRLGADVARAEAWASVAIAARV